MVTDITSRNPCSAVISRLFCGKLFSKGHPHPQQYCLPLRFLVCPRCSIYINIVIKTCSFWNIYISFFNKQPACDENRTLWQAPAQHTTSADSSQKKNSVFLNWVHNAVATSPQDFPFSVFPAMKLAYCLSQMKSTAKINWSVATSQCVSQSQPKKQAKAEKVNSTLFNSWFPFDIDKIGLFFLLFSVFFQFSFVISKWKSSYQKIHSTSIIIFLFCFVFHLP